MTGNVARMSLLKIAGAISLAMLPRIGFADMILLDRGLPNASNASVPYVNDAGQSDTSCQPTYPNCRANVSWQSGFGLGGNYFMAGDDFSFGTNATVSTITVYEIANNPVSSIANSLPTSEFNSISLFVGPQNGTLSLVASSYAFQRVAYAPATDYQGTLGAFFPIYAITFSLPDTLFAANTLYGFAVDATPNTSNPAYCNTTSSCYGLFLAASNAGLSSLSGATEQGADNNFIYYGEASQAAQAPSFVGTCNSGDPSCGGWDKGSDLNVTITGTAISAVPEPQTFGLFTIAFLGGLLTQRCRMRR